MATGERGDSRGTAFQARSGDTSTRQDESSAAIPRFAVDGGTFTPVGAGGGAVRAKDTTVARQGLEHDSAMSALVEKLTGVRRHALLALTAAPWAANRRGQVVAIVEHWNDFEARWLEVLQLRRALDSWRANFACNHALSRHAEKT